MLIEEMIPELAELQPGATTGLSITNNKLAEICEKLLNDYGHRTGGIIKCKKLPDGLKVFLD
jgi:hypothetical protein